MDNHILLVIFVASLIFSISASEENAGDEVKNAFGSFLDEAKEALGPTSTWDLDKVKDTFSPSVEEAKEALGPISSLKEELSPLSSSIIDEAKQAISPSTKSKASKHIDSITSWLSQNELGPTPSSSLQKEEEKEEEEASPQSPNEEDGQNKEEMSFEEAQKELGPISSSDLDKDEEDVASTPINEAEEKLGSLNKEEMFSDSPSNLDDAQNELGPISFDDDLDKEEDASSPASSSSFNEAKEALGSISSKAFDVAKEKLGKIRSLLSHKKEKVSSESPSISDQDQEGTIDDLDKNEDASSSVSSLDEPEEPFAPVSPSNSNEAMDDYKQDFGITSLLSSENKEEVFSDSPSILDEAQKELGPISSFDLDKDEDDASSPVSSPVSPSTFDEAKEALGSISSQASNVEKDKLRSLLSENKEEISSDSPSILDEAQEGPTSPTSSSDDDVLNKDKDASSPDEYEEAFSPVSPSNSNEENYGITSLLSDNKEEVFYDSPSILDEAQKELGPISSSDLDKQEEQEDAPVPSSYFNEEKEALASISSQGKKIRSLLSHNKQKKSSDSSSNLDKAQEELSPISSNDEDASSPVSFLYEDEEAASPVTSSISNEAKEALDNVDGSFGPIMSQNKHDTSSDSSSILEEAQKELGPISSFDLDNKDEEDEFSPISPSPSPIDDEVEKTLGSVSSEAFNQKIRSLISEEISSFDLDEEKRSISSEALKQNFIPTWVEIIPSKSSIYPIYFDHDVALAIESLIKQGQSNSELAIEEAEKLLLSDAAVALSEKGKCVKKCKSDYASCVDNLQKAMEDLRGRNAELLTDDVNAVEGDISACQKCYLENTQNQSPLKDLEEAIIKATRECLNVLHHSS